MSAGNRCDCCDPGCLCPFCDDGPCFEVLSLGGGPGFSATVHGTGYTPFNAFAETDGELIACIAAQQPQAGAVAASSGITNGDSGTMVCALLAGDEGPDPATSVGFYLFIRGGVLKMLFVHERFGFGLGNYGVYFDEIDVPAGATAVTTDCAALGGSGTATRADGNDPQPSSVAWSLVRI